MKTKSIKVGRMAMPGKYPRTAKSPSGGARSSASPRKSERNKGKVSKMGGNK